MFLITFCFFFFFFFFFNDTATTEIYTLSLHDALPISRPPGRSRPRQPRPPPRHPGRPVRWPQAPPAGRACSAPGRRPASRCELPRRYPPTMSEPTTSPQASQALGGSGLDPDTATVAALRQALTEGRITAGELTAFYLSRIDRLNPVLGAVISVSPDAATDARASDEARAEGAVPGPLEGIPVLIKDNIAVRGMPATAGSPALAEAEQDEAFLVTRLREAGAVILGKANLSEWANFRSSHSSSGWSTLGGQAVNPHGPGRSPSGSSSGSGVAVAAGLAPIAVGTETDGSIVCPASACGIVGIKPTLGLVSRSGIVPISLAQDTAGPMTRSVADAAALLSV